MRHIGDERRDVALDFGCGSGVMLPFLSARARRVIAMDQDLSPLGRMTDAGLIPPNVERVQASEAGLAAIPDRTVDLVLALDVLEHVADLDGTIDDLCRILSPRGRLLVSGPTENLLYKIGRRVAGSVYTGTYHKRGVKEIRQALDRRAEVRTVATLFPIVTFFELFEAREKRRSQ